MSSRGLKIFSKIFYPIFYIIFAAAISLSICFIVQKNVPTKIYVSGTSMKPTLMGDVNTDKRINYGYAYTDYYTRTHLKRFDVVITYFPESWNTGKNLKVKRVWGFPGETLNLTCLDDSAVFTVGNGETVYEEYIAEKILNKTYTFERYDKEIGIYSYKEQITVFKFDNGVKKFDTRAVPRDFSITLKENEYFLMGDNWGGSTDSYEKITDPHRISLENIQGKVICIEGTARLEGTTLVDKKKYPPKYNF